MGKKVYTLPAPLKMKISIVKSLFAKVQSERNSVDTKFKLVKKSGRSCKKWPLFYIYKDKKLKSGSEATLT